MKARQGEPAPMVDLSGRVALVTGASRGIGRSIALALARCGARLVLSARNAGKLAEAAAGIERLGAEAVAVPADLAREEQIAALYARARDTFGRLDIAVHNAGIGYFEELADFPLDRFEEILRVNLRGTFLCCQQAMKLMVPARRGAIINIASVQGIKAYPKQSVYAASKHGIMGLTKALAAEAQPHGIRVSAVLPGAVDTELIAEARPDLDRSQLIHPDDIARTVLFLLSLSERAMVDMIVVRRSTAAPF